MFILFIEKEFLWNAQLDKMEIPTQPKKILYFILYHRNVEWKRLCPAFKFHLIGDYREEGDCVLRESRTRRRTLVLKGLHEILMLSERPLKG